MDEVDMVLFLEWLDGEQHLLKPPSKKDSRTLEEIGRDYLLWRRQRMVASLPRFVK